MLIPDKEDILKGDVHERNVFNKLKNFFKGSANFQVVLRLLTIDRNKFCKLQYTNYPSASASGCDSRMEK